MRKIREVLRLKWFCGLGDRDIAQSCGISRSSVSKYCNRAKTAGLSWPLPDTISDDVLEQMIIQTPNLIKETSDVPDWPTVYKELRRKGVTLHLLWEEYHVEHPDGYQYSQFCFLYQKWREVLDLPMHQNHKAGEKMFVDYCGQTVPITDRESGTIHPAQIFVAVLGASNYTYAEAFGSQSLPEWIMAHINAFRFFGGVPDLIVPDNMKSGIQLANRYEPDINRTYEEMARHYGSAIIPAHVRKPKDKAKVEKGVQDVERRLLAPLRNRTFFSIQALNEDLEALLYDHNRRPFQKMPGSRWSLFEEIDKPALKTLPRYPYEYAEWKKARVNIDYHVEVNGHYYSVPFQWVNQNIDVRMTVQAIECFHRTKRIASHLRSDRKGQYSTISDHMPKRHQEYAKWTPDRLMEWAEKTGIETRRVVETIMASRPHPQQGFRACLGLMRLGKEYGSDRLEAACKRALRMNVVGFKSIDSILKRNLDQLPIPEETPERPAIQHDNIRGPEYYR
ncbi:IS21 family transposase [bacterium]|nr:IS21 family transposase [candidate division CSSED10-310 bacterium]